MASQRMAKSLALGESSGRGYSSTGCGASPWTHGCQSPRGPGAWVRARSSQQVSGCRSRREDGGASLQVLSSWTPSLRPSSPGLAPEWRPPGIHREGRPGDAGQVVEEERRQSGLRPERSLPWELDRSIFVPGVASSFFKFFFSETALAIICPLLSHVNQESIWNSFL